MSRCFKIVMLAPSAFAAHLVPSATERMSLPWPRPAMCAWWIRAIRSHFDAVSKTSWDSGASRSSMDLWHAAREQMEVWACSMQKRLGDSRAPKGFECT